MSEFWDSKANFGDKSELLDKKSEFWDKSAFWDSKAETSQNSEKANFGTSQNE